jgi:hypothetical protein
MKRPWVPVLGALLVLLIGGSAFAFYGPGPKSIWGAGWRGWCPGPAYMWGGYDGDDDFVGRKRLERYPYKYEIPAEMAQKMRDLERTRLELRMLFLEDKLDQKKATELHERILSLRTDVSRWQFEQWLKVIEQRQSGAPSNNQ